MTTAQGKLEQAADPSQVESAKAQLDLAKQSLTYTQIYVAIDGYVGEKSAEVGQTVSAGITLMTLIPHNVYITANFKETQMGTMRVGQPVDINVDAYKGVTFHGHVDVDQSGVAEHLRARSGAKRDRQLREGDAAHSGSHLDRR